MKNSTLILGSSGYIGSNLKSYLNNSCGVDILENKYLDIHKDYDKIPKSELKKYCNIILLAAHSNPTACNGNPLYSLENNVVKFVKLLRKISKKQKFIYASSSCVYDSKNGEVVTEESNSFTPLSYYDVTKKVIDYYAELSDVEFYGLRFGSVNGTIDSCKVVKDGIIINAMTKNAVKDKIVKAINPEVHRAILGIKDLCRAVEAVINGNDKRGLYNLASFNSTIGEIGKFVASKYNANFQVENNMAKTLYDFQVSCDKFAKVYNFAFEETLDSITDSISSDIDNVKFIRGMECIKV